MSGDAEFNITLPAILSFQRTAGTRQVSDIIDVISSRQLSKFALKPAAQTHHACTMYIHTYSVHRPVTAILALACALSLLGLLAHAHLRPQQCSSSLHCVLACWLPPSLMPWVYFCGSMITPGVFKILGRVRFLRRTQKRSESFSHPQEHLPPTH